MTPIELEQIRKMIDGAVDKAISRVVQPLREDIDLLKLVDKRHSLTHRDLATSVTRTQSEVEHKVGDTATALAVRDRDIVQALGMVATRLAAVERDSIKPGTLAAQGAMTAAEAAKNATTAIAIGQVEAKAELRSGRVEGRLRSLAGFVVLVILGLLNHFAKG